MSKTIVITGCICRVNVMAWREHKAGWLLIYIGMAYFAGDVAIDALHVNFVEPHDAVILAVLALYMLMTRKISGSAPAMVTTFHTSLIGGAIMSAVTFLYWVPPTPWIWMILVLLAFLFVMNGLAILLRKRFERRW